MSTFTTTNLAQAAFLKMRGLKITKGYQSKSGVSRMHNFNFVFEDPEEVGESLVLEFLNSEFATFDDNLRKMRGLMKSGSGQ